MVDPSLVVHAYGYDERGLLLTDQLGDDPAQTLSSAPVATATTRGEDYVRTSPAGHATSLHLESTLDGTSTQRLTHADGTSRSSTRDSAWQVTQSDAQGSMTQTMRADPVLGSSAAYPAHTELTLGTHSVVVDQEVTGDLDPMSTTTVGSVHQIYATSGLMELNHHSATWSGGGSFNESIDSRDGAGRILEETETGGVMRGYRDDADGRVTEERRCGVVSATYAYDAQGNRTALHRDAPGTMTESRSGARPVPEMMPSLVTASRTPASVEVSGLRAVGMAAPRARPWLGWRRLGRLG